MSKAKYWIINCKMPIYICKKENQFYLQTWHGTPLKRLAHDIDVSEDTTFYGSPVFSEQMCNSYDVDVARYHSMNFTKCVLFPSVSKCIWNQSESTD